MKMIIILFLLSSVVYAQREKIKAGYGLKERRDSLLVISTDAPTFKIIGDSLGYGGGGGTSADSIAREGRVLSIEAHWAVNDTNQIWFFNYISNSPGGINQYAWRGTTVAMVSPRTLLPIKMAISHIFDSTGTLSYSRDTVMYFKNIIGLDSIPEKRKIFIQYLPYSITTDYQKISIISADVHATNNSSSYVAIPTQCQVPFILGVPQYNKGVRVDHQIHVTLYFMEKIPGRKYW